MKSYRPRLIVKDELKTGVVFIVFSIFMLFMFNNIKHKESHLKNEGISTYATVRDFKKTITKGHNSGINRMVDYCFTISKKTICKNESINTTIAWQAVTTVGKQGEIEVLVDPNNYDNVRMAKDISENGPPTIAYVFFYGMLTIGVILVYRRMRH